jgi:N-acetylglucosaminyldiphosphoundecaprenol N-acetyl-beta-D-mannosaminyltransferase
VIVIDEASGDPTRRLLRDMDDERLVVLRHDVARGVSAARNAGVRAASGSHVAFCDDDDLWAPNLLEAHVAALESHGRARWSMSGCVSFAADGAAVDIRGHRRPPRPADLIDLLADENVVPTTSGVVVERALFHEAGGFDEELEYAEDWDLWSRLARRSDAAVIDRPLVAYRVPGSAEGPNLSSDVAAVQHTRQRRGDANVGISFDRSVARSAMANGSRRAAARHLGRIVRTTRSPVDAARLVAGVTLPKAGARAGRWRSSVGVPLAWRAAASAWLPDIVEQAGDPLNQVPVESKAIERSPVPWPGLPAVHRIDLGGAAAVIAGRPGSTGGTVVTPNVHHLWTLERDAAFRDAYRVADLVLADGAPIVRAAHRIGSPVPERAAGSDLLWYVAARAERTGARLALLGGVPGAARRAAEALEVTFPDLADVLVLCPPMGFLDDDVSVTTAVELLESAAPDVVFVALGSPAQELFGQHLRERLANTWFIGVGAALDMAAGEVRRAPAWMGSLGLEWMFRLGQEPRRLAARYLVHDVPVALRLAHAVSRQRSRTAVRNIDSSSIAATRMS